MPEANNRHLPEFKEGEVLLESEHFLATAYLRPDRAAVEKKNRANLNSMGISHSKKKAFKEMTDKNVQRICVAGKDEAAKEVLRRLSKRQFNDPDSEPDPFWKTWPGIDPNAFYLQFDHDCFDLLCEAVNVNALLGEYDESSDPFDELTAPTETPNLRYALEALGEHTLDPSMDEMEKLREILLSKGAEAESLDIETALEEIRKKVSWNLNPTE